MLLSMGSSLWKICRAAAEASYWHKHTLWHRVHSSSCMLERTFAGDLTKNAYTLPCFSVTVAR